MSSGCCRTSDGALSNAPFSALTVTFFFLLLVGIGIPLRTSLFAAAMVGLGTPIFADSGWLFSEPLTASVYKSSVAAVRPQLSADRCEQRFVISLWRLTKYARTPSPFKP